jgi:hypothetical protein
MKAFILKKDLMLLEKWSASILTAEKDMLIKDMFAFNNFGVRITSTFPNEETIFWLFVSLMEASRRGNLSHICK